MRPEHKKTFKQLNAVRLEHKKHEKKTQGCDVWTSRPRRPEQKKTFKNTTLGVQNLKKTFENITRCVQNFKKKTFKHIKL